MPDADGLGVLGGPSTRTGTPSGEHAKVAERDKGSTARGGLHEYIALVASRAAAEVCCHRRMGGRDYRPVAGASFSATARCVKGGAHVFAGAHPVALARHIFFADVDPRHAHVLSRLPPWVLLLWV